MAMERIELRLSPANPEERALIEALESHSGEYGAMGRFLKARLLRGYVAFQREVEAIRSESDPLAALDRLAQSINSGHYRVLRALLYPQTLAVGVSASTARVNAILAATAEDERGTNDFPAAPTRPGPELPIERPASAAQVTESANPAPPLPNWPAFAAIAGSKG
jgi:hypothetical protein